MKLLIIAAAAALTVAVSTGSFADEKKVKLKVKPYPMDVCVVSGEKLDSMGEPYVFAEGDQEVQFCCKSCKKDFDKDKKASLAKIEEAAKKVKPYPLTKCIVSGEALEDGEAVGLVFEGREFDFCCKNCIKDFKKDTVGFVKKFDEAAAKKKS